MYQRRVFPALPTPPRGCRPLPEWILLADSGRAKSSFPPRAIRYRFLTGVKATGSSFGVDVTPRLGCDVSLYTCTRARIPAVFRRRVKLAVRALLVLLGMVLIADLLFRRLAGGVATASNGEQTCASQKLDESPSGCRPVRIRNPSGLWSAVSLCGCHHTGLAREHRGCSR